jgi:hypothetical protein
MTPIDPATSSRENPRSMEPPYSDENPNLESVREGLGVAEDEARNVVEETYETSADASDLDADFIDDEDEVSGEEVPYAPELAAMHEGSLTSPVGDFERENGDSPDEQVERAEEYDPEDDA